MTTYVALADVNEEAFQNVQELASIWGEVRTELDELDAELRDAYALLGGRDLLLLFEAPNEDVALKASFAVERYGIHTETMQAIDVDELGRLVDEV